MKLYDSPQVAQRPIDGRTAMVSPGIVPEMSLAPGLAAVAQQVTAEAERVSKLRIEDAANKISAVYAGHAEEAAKLKGASAFIPDTDEYGQRGTASPMDKFKEKARADADKILAEAGTQFQRDSIEKIILDHDGRLNIALMKHQDAELVRYGDSVKSATYGRSMNAALAAAAIGDKAGFQSNFDAAAEAFKGVSTNRGLDLSQELNNRQSKAALEAVTNMVKSKIVVGGLNGPNAYLFEAMTNPDDLADAKKLIEVHDTKNETLKMAEDTFYKGITAEEVRAAAQVFYPDDADKNKAYVDHMHARMHDVAIDQEKVDKDRNGEVIAEATRTKSWKTISDLITVVDTDTTMSKAARGHTISTLRSLLNGIKDGPEATLANRVAAARWMASPEFGAEVRADKDKAITKAASFGVHNFDYAMAGVNAAFAPNSKQAPVDAKTLAKRLVQSGRKSMTKDEEEAFDEAVVATNMEHTRTFENTGKGQAAPKEWSGQDWVDKIVNRAKQRPSGWISKTSLYEASKSDKRESEYKDILGQIAPDQRKLAEFALRDIGVPKPTALQIINQVDEHQLLQRDNPDIYESILKKANLKTTLPNGRAAADKPVAKAAAAKENK